MVSEKVILNFDIQRLQEHVTCHVLNLNPVMRGSYFGGWSVYSSSGSYMDGWARGELLFRDDFMPGASLAEKSLALGIKNTSDHCVETEICFGYLKEVMDKISGFGLSPRRARLSLLRAHGSSSLHIDGPENSYCVRLHIPIITNKDCVFCVEQKEEHFQADGNGYFVSVSRPHQVFNRGNTDRIHLIMDVIDDNGFTKYHQRTGFL